MLFSEDEIFDYCPEQLLPDMMLWEFKHDREKFKVLETGDPYTCSSQYQQKTSPIGGGMFKDAYWRYYEMLPADIQVIRIYGDTAQKTKERND